MGSKEAAGGWDNCVIGKNIRSLGYKNGEVDELCSYVSHINLPES